MDAFTFFLVVTLIATPANAALELSTDHRSLSFGLMQPGEEKVLAQSGSFHTEVTCASTGGMTWHVKISLLQPLTAGAESIPLESFGWQVTRTDGNGTVVSPSEFRSFSVMPDLVYISGPGEADGRPVRLQFRYRLQLPETQVGGAYHANLRFTLTEVL